MASEKRLIDANALLVDIEEELAYDSPMYTAEQNKWIDTGLRIAAHNLRRQPPVDAVEVNRLGKLGRLMMPYKGDPRGHMGARGCSGEDFRAIELDPITDVDGNRWIPVLEQDLCDMKARADDAVEVVHGEWAIIEGDALWDRTVMFQCSACGVSQTSLFGRSNYCPNCGAKMYGDGNG